MQSLASFKTTPCGNPLPHSPKCCVGYHSPQDQRRSPPPPESSLCRFAQKGRRCPAHPLCRFAHNMVEAYYHPSAYKTKLCAKQDCEYGEFCCFAHREEELRVPLIHLLPRDDAFYRLKYKTQFCPMSYLPHERGECVYAHNWQDFRRAPSDVDYSELPCPDWDGGQFLNTYWDGCPRGLNCLFAHGWNELKYHAKNLSSTLQKYHFFQPGSFLPKNPEEVYRNK